MKALKIILLLCITDFLLSACSSSLSPHFTKNYYRQDFYHYLLNPTLKLRHESYGDIDFIQKKSALKRLLKEKNYQLEQVLAYGKSSLAPFYEYFILHNSSSEGWNLPTDAFIRDTLLQANKFTFIGIPLGAGAMQNDFENLSKNWFIGEGFQREGLELNALLKTYHNSNDFWSAYQAIEGFNALSVGEEQFKLQIQLTYASFLGEGFLYQECIKKWEKERLKPEIKTVIQEKATQGIENTKKLILEKSASTQLLMFNENHFYPAHRRLLTELLPELKAQGFEYLALEALFRDDKLNEGKTLSLEDGFYTREQNFKALIDQAQKLGFKFIAYENQNTEIDRELGQAQNLYQASFAQNPSAKVIVLGGVSHIHEEADQNGKSWMAKVFKDKYGINPLTFSQTALNNYRNIIPNLGVLSQEDISQPSYQACDYYILNNLSVEAQHSPNFNYHNTAEEVIYLQLLEIPENEEQLDSLVPLRSVLLTPREVYKSYIPHKNLMMRLINNKAKIIFEEQISLLP